MKTMKFEPGENPNGDGACFIDFVCESTSHPGRKSHIALFVRRLPDFPQWALMPLRADGGRGHITKWARQELDGDRLIPENERQQTPAKDSKLHRARYPLSCDLCPESLTMKQETLFPILDRLAEHADASEMDLAELRARLR